MSNFRGTGQMIKRIVADLTKPADSRVRNCSSCKLPFVVGVGAWAEKGYYVPHGELCAWCIEIRNHAIELGLESSREIEADDDRYSN